MRLRILLSGMALVAATSGSALAADNLKIGFITKFPVPFYTTMENAAKAYAAAHPGLEIIYGQGTSATDIEGQIALIESMVTKGVKGLAITPVDPTVRAGARQSGGRRRESRAHGQQHPELEGPNLARHHEQLQCRRARRSVSEDGSQGGRQARQFLEGVPGVPALDDRVKGMLEGLKGVDDSPSSARALTAPEEKGINVAQDILTASPRRQGDLLGLRPARRRRGAGDQERRTQSTRHSGRFRLLLRRTGGDGGGAGGCVGGAIPGEDGGTGRRRAGEVDARRQGRVADRLGRRAVTRRTTSTNSSV